MFITRNGLATLIIVPAAVGYFFGTLPPARTNAAHAEIATDAAPTMVQVAVPVEQPSPLAARTRIDAATAAYDEAVNGYVALLNKSAALEAKEQKSKIKAKLSGNTTWHSPEVQSTYDAKDIAEAKMKAAEVVMNAAIADMGVN